MIRCEQDPTGLLNLCSPPCTSPVVRSRHAKHTKESPFLFQSALELKQAPTMAWNSEPRLKMSLQKPVHSASQQPHKLPEFVTTSCIERQSPPYTERVGAIFRYPTRPIWPILLIHRLSYRVEADLGTITSSLNPGPEESLGQGGVICTMYVLCYLYFNRDI